MFNIKARITRFLYPNKLKAYNLKFPPFIEPRSLAVLASNEEEALLMRRYLIDEVFEGATIKKNMSYGNLGELLGD